jgi:hypothetical protein
MPRFRILPQTAPASISAHYATLSEDGTPEYHQYRYASANLINSHREHREGRKGLRNVQDLAFKLSHALRDQLKEHWKQSRGGLQPITERAPVPVEMDSTDDKAGYAVEQPGQPTSSAPRASSLPLTTSSNKQKASPLMSQTGPSKRHRSRIAAPETAAPEKTASAAQLATQEPQPKTGTRPRRGRARMETGPARPAVALQSGPARERPRRRGRPRKDE